MTGCQSFKLLIIALVIILPVQVTLAVDRGVFSNKSMTQHGLTEWEKDKMAAEFLHQLTPSKPGTSSGQKMGTNPWQAKKAKQQQHNLKMLQLSNSWGNCREFSYKQRGQCYERGGDAYTCERYYDARVAHCNSNF